MRILIPQGIGDAIWALHKIQDLAKRKGDGRIHAYIACCNAKSPEESRALEFVRRFRFIERADMWSIKLAKGQQGCLLKPGGMATRDGYYNYIPDGPASVPGSAQMARDPHSLTGAGPRSSRIFRDI